ncbi:TPA: elongation factor G, partial [Enterococcus faecium]|nr:elongation factor G [Enterococcus faecium]
MKYILSFCTPKLNYLLAYIRLYSGVLHLRDSVRVSEKEKIKVTEMYTSINGELCKIDRAYSGEI